MMLSLGHLAAESRVWTDAKGRKVDAELSGVESDRALLVLANGKEMGFPIKELSDADRDYIARHQENIAIAAAMGVFPVPTAEKRERPDLVSLKRLQAAVNEVSDQVYQSASFQFTSQSPLSDSSANTIAQAFEVTKLLVEALPWGVKCRPLEEEGFYQARIFESQAAYHKEGGPSNSSGVYLLKDKVFLLPIQSLSADGKSSVSRNKGESTATLTHEITHQMMHHYLPFLPMWVAEGSAEYVSLLPFTGRQYRISGAANGLKKYADQFRGEETLPDLWSFLRMPRKEWEAISNGRRGQLTIESQREIPPGVELYAQSTFLLYYFNHLDGDGSGLRFNRFMDVTRETMMEWGHYNVKFAAYSKKFNEVYKVAAAAHQAKIDIYNAKLKAYRAEMDEFLKLPGVQLKDGRVYYPRNLKMPDASHLQDPGDGPVPPKPPEMPDESPEAAAMKNVEVLLDGRTMGELNAEFIEKINKVLPNLQVKKLISPDPIPEPGLIPGPRPWLPME